MVRLVAFFFIIDLSKIDQRIIMNLGNSLFHARKKSGFSQEKVEEKIGLKDILYNEWKNWKN